MISEPMLRNVDELRNLLNAAHANERGEECLCGPLRRTVDTLDRQILAWRAG